MCALGWWARYVNAFAVIAHAFWGTWAIIQARYSPIDFDFLQYVPRALWPHGRWAVLGCACVGWRWWCVGCGMFVCVCV